MQKQPIVALDSNMLLNVARFRVDIFEQAKGLIGNARFVVPKQVLRELDTISKGKGKLAGEARIAQKLLEKRGFEAVEPKARGTDDALLKLAEECIIATNDRKLMDSVKKIGGKVLFLRQRKFLDFTG